MTLGAGPGGWTGMALGLAGLGAAVLGAFLWWEGRQGDDAMVPLSLFGSRPFVGLTLLTLLLYAALGAMLVLLPCMLIEAAGYSGTAAGAALLPMPLVLAVASPVMGSLAARIGSRLPLALGPLVVAVGFLLMLRVDADTGYWSGLLPAILVVALGMSGAVAPLTTAVLASVDDRHTGLASGLNSAVARTGGLVATALLGGALAAEGDALLSAFHLACWACAGASALAGGAFLLLFRDAGSSGAADAVRRPA